MGVNILLGSGPPDQVTEGRSRIETYLQCTENYLSVVEDLQSLLMQLPLEKFGDVVRSFETREYRDEADPEAVRRKRVSLEFFKKILEEVVCERGICSWCYEGETRESGGRNGGEQYTVCSNSECITHFFT